MVLGARSGEDDVVSITLATELFVVLTRRINDLVNYYTPEFRMTTIRIFAGTTTTLVTALRRNLGNAMAMLFGDFSGGAFVSDAEKVGLHLDKAGMFIPTRAHRAEPAEGNVFLCHSHTTWSNRQIVFIRQASS